jgi:hypothetical protein
VHHSVLVSVMLYRFFGMIGGVQRVSVGDMGVVRGCFPVMFEECVHENAPSRSRFRKVGRYAFTSILPVFLPSSMSMNARGVFSNPSTMSSRYWILPS